LAKERITGRQKDVAKMLRQRKGPPAERKFAGRTTGKTGNAGIAGKTAAGGSLLSIALRNEKAERAFYLRHAEKTENRIEEAMFRLIADDELEHYDALKRLLKGDIGEIGMSEEASEKIKDVLRRQVLNAKKAPRSSAGDLDAVRTAIKFEAEGASRYEEMRDSSNDPAQKRLFDLLASMEHGHFLSLRELEELMTDPASWNTWRERHSLDGG